MDRLRQALLRRLAATAAALLAAGCGRDAPHTVYVQSDWSPEEEGKIVEAIDDWNALAERRLADPRPLLVYGGRASVPEFAREAMDDGRSVIYRIGRPTPEIDALERETGPFGGYGCYGDMLLVPYHLCQDCDDYLRYLRITTTHELGHFLGFPHYQNRPGIMNPGDWDSDRLTAADEDMFCQFYDCR